MSWIDWLNANAGAVQALATVILVAVTIVYVAMTSRIAKTTKQAVKLGAILYFLGDALVFKIAKRNKVVKVLFPKDKEFEVICRILSGKD